MTKASLEVELPTLWTDEKQRWEETEKRTEKERRSEKRKSQKKEDAGARQGRKSRSIVFFQCFVAPEGRRVGSLKRRVRSHPGRWEMKNCSPLWCEAHVEVKMLQAHTSTTCSDNFWKFRGWKSARRRFGTKHISKWTCTKHFKFGAPLEVRMPKNWEHFWKFRCRKNARHCGAKHISKSKCETHTMFGPLLDVQPHYNYKCNNNNSNSNSNNNKYDDDYYYYYY